MAKSKKKKSGLDKPKPSLLGGPADGQKYSWDDFTEDASDFGDDVWDSVEDGADWLTDDVLNAISDNANDAIDDFHQWVNDTGENIGDTFETAYDDSLDFLNTTVDDISAFFNTAGDLLGNWDGLGGGDDLDIPDFDSLDGDGEVGGSTGGGDGVPPDVAEDNFWMDGARYWLSAERSRKRSQAGGYLGRRHALPGGAR